jgi:hypothetical protein
MCRARHRVRLFRVGYDFVVSTHVKSRLPPALPHRQRTSCFIYPSYIANSTLIAPTSFTASIPRWCQSNNGSILSRRLLKYVYEGSLLTAATDLNALPSTTRKAMLYALSFITCRSSNRLIVASSGS